MPKKSSLSRLSANPVRVSLIDQDDRRRTQTLKSRTGSTSEETLIPRPRIRSSSADSRKSSLKPPARVQHSQYGSCTPTPGTVTPGNIQSATSSRHLLPPSGSSLRARSPSAERASNIGARSSRKDNRPLGEKSFQAEMLQKIDSYLKSVQQSNLVNSTGSLRPITLKMFVEVSDLLVKLLDVKQGLTLVNYVEELPKIAKKLHYPGPINKSWLKTANAMHSWPHVLGWLSWLAETCTIKDLAFEHFQLETLPLMEGENSGDLNRLKFQFLLDAYKAWNEEKPNEEAALTDNYLKKVASLQGVNETDISNATVELENETKRLDDVKEISQVLDNELKEIEESLRSAKSQEIKQDAYMKELKDMEKKHLTETERLKKVVQYLQSIMQQQKLRQEELKAQIESQPMSVIERDEIVESCAAMSNQMRELNKHLEDLEKEIYTLDLKLGAARNTVNKAVFAYNKDIYLHLDKEADIDLYDIEMPVTGIINRNIMDELHKKAHLMAAYYENMEKRIKNIKTTMESDQQQLDSLEGQLTALEMKKQDLLSKACENKDRIKKIQAAAKAEEIELKESIENLKHLVTNVREKIPDLEQEEKELLEAKEKLEAVRRRKVYLEESAELFFREFFEILTNHRTKLAQVLGEKP
ncbi:kinetochore protein ndc80 [Athalia rosae]|uniref:kinetochore protein ndc80 n=1 Tax=Athalia rosae TaxID=37344 RepID=UPI002033624F|nr:kinetochore protein ndc80 [Athalia rosae]XP_048507531.1 kinetochore protein ndc80 [Athalia rosae]